MLYFLEVEHDKLVTNLPVKGSPTIFSLSCKMLLRFSIKLQFAK